MVVVNLIRSVKSDIGIINGEKEIGISVHYMDSKELDAGDIVQKDYYQIKKNTTITDVYKYMKKHIPHMFVNAIKIIEKGDMTSTGQSSEQSSILHTYPRISKFFYYEGQSG